MRNFKKFPREFSLFFHEWQSNFTISSWITVKNGKFYKKLGWNIKFLENVLTWSSKKPKLKVNYPHACGKKLLFAWESLKKRVSKDIWKIMQNNKKDWIKFLILYIKIFTRDNELYYYIEGMQEIRSLGLGNENFEVSRLEEKKCIWIILKLSHLCLGEKLEKTTRNLNYLLAQIDGEYFFLKSFFQTILAFGGKKLKWSWLK